MKNIYCLLLLMLLGACSKSKIESSSLSGTILGQTAPPDMLHVPGDDTFLAFYISKIEEPNINYLTYLLYLQSIYGESYPDYVKAAIPKKPLGKQKHYYNDPYLESYLTHPAFAYYPVTNLTYEQIENYLSWKTDRLNETILIKTGIYNLNFEQKDEDCFNTEAYLNGQYQGYVKKGLLASHGGERPAGLSDGILFTGYRLPTEAEWDYLSQSKYNQLDKSKLKFKHHPFGEDYFTLKWLKALGRRNADYTLKGGISEDLMSFNSEQIKIPEEAQVAQLSQAFNYLQYDHISSKNIYNLHGGVREWTLDPYQDQPNPKDLSWINVLEQAGYEINNGLRDEHGRYVEKDFTGRMKYFRYIGIDANGEGREIEQYGTIDAYLKSMEELQSRLQLMIKDFPRTIRDNAMDAAYIQRLENRKIEITALLNSKKDLARHELYRLKQEMDQVKKETSNNAYRYTFGNWSQSKNSLESLEQELEKVKKTIILLENKKRNFNNPNRVVKGGTWKNPGDERSFLKADSSAIDVGFRCILPYSGTPLLKKYKVKWNQEPLKLD